MQARLVAPQANTSPLEYMQVQDHDSFKRSLTSVGSNNRGSDRSVSQATKHLRFLDLLMHFHAQTLAIVMIEPDLTTNALGIPLPSCMTTGQQSMDADPTTPFPPP
eukprot:5174443-Amphidinium_carterae.1